MEFKVAYKIAYDQQEWSYLELNSEQFNSNWDKEQILSEIEEYIYVSESDDDIESIVIQEGEVNKIFNGLKTKKLKFK